MKFRKIYALVLAAAASAMSAAAATDCDLQILVVEPNPVENEISEGVARQVANRLTRALTFSGVTADENYGQLYLSAKFSHLYKENLPGPPAQVALHTEMTLFVADLFGNKIFDSETFELRGVGNSEQRAFINAMQSVNAKSKALENFVSRAKQKTVAYFDKNYTTILTQASRAAAQRDYEQALYYSTLIPACSKGYAAAEAATQQYYQSYIDFTGTQLLTQARAVFAADPTGDGALKAFALIGQIDPESSAYKSAMSFADQVAKQAQREYDFEVHQKYEDEVATERRKIDAAKAVGVAYGQGQKNSTTNILWK